MDFPVGFDINDQKGTDVLKLNKIYTDWSRLSIIGLKHLKEDWLLEVLNNKVKYIHVYSLEGKKS